MYAVNGVVANKDTVIKNSDVITHRVHRHEPPVVGDKIDIIHKDDDLVVINKPPSIPVCFVMCVCVCVHVCLCLYVRVYVCHWGITENIDGIKHEEIQLCRLYGRANGLIMAGK